MVMPRLLPLVVRGDAGVTAWAIDGPRRLWETSNSASPRALTAPEFARLADVPPEAQWFANLTSIQTRRAYQSDLRGFMAFTGIVQPEEFRLVTRARPGCGRASLSEIPRAERWR